MYKNSMNCINVGQQLARRKNIKLLVYETKKGFIYFIRYQINIIEYN